MSSKAGPSSASKSKTKSEKKVPKVAEPVKSQMSKETVDSDDDLESRVDDDDAGSESDDDLDSEEDLENVQPKHKANGGGAKSGNATSSGSGSGWPKYQPPNGMAPVNVDTRYTDSPFEWDAIASKPNVELWAIRVPADLKTKYLTSMKLSRPTSSSASSDAKLGTLSTKSRTYNLVNAGHAHKIKAAVTSEGRDPTSGPSAADVMKMDVDQAKVDEEDLRREGGEEMQGMTLMLPRVSRKGKLYSAPKAISRHLILEPDQSITAEPAAESLSTNPSFLSTGREPAINLETALPAKRVQPTHLLKFRNKTIGFDTPGPGGAVVSPSASEPTQSNGATGVEQPAEKKKRRKSEKGDGETPKKKKAKV